MISTKPLFNQIEEQTAVNIRSVVRFLHQTTSNTVLVQDDGYYASYAVPMTQLATGITRQVTVLLDFTIPNYGGVRYWLVCEHCHKRVANLYAAADTLACRHCLRLEYGCRLYGSNPLCSAFMRHKKAAALFTTRRLSYGGKPTRAGRRLNRLVSPTEFGMVVNDLLSVN